MCQGWLEGYLLTGRHGFFSCYEAFIHIIDSMFNQHAKWLKVATHIPWRRPIASLNYLLTSHVWRQDHNGFSHQDPGFIDHVVNKKADIIRVYLPPDANCLLSVTDHCLRSRNYVNVIVAGKQPAPQWLTMDQPIKHCTAGLGIWEWASNDRDGEPDVVMACCGDTPTLETLAAVDLLRKHVPELKVRVINVVDLMKLQPPSEHPHGLCDRDFDALFTTDKPIVFAFHGYPWLIHRLTYRRTNHKNLHVRGYKEEGTTTTPFDMCVLNDLDRFHLVRDVIDRVPNLGSRAAYAKQALDSALIEHRQYIAEHGEDLPAILNWKWSGSAPRHAEFHGGRQRMKTLVERYNCGPVKLSGDSNALYERHVMFDQVVAETETTNRDKFEAIARSVRDVLSQRWLKTEQGYRERNAKRVYYLSMEFLLGRALANNLTNLQLGSEAQQFAKQHRLDPLKIIEQEPNPGLGNGGLGRLAACFLDSMATLGIPGMGYGLRYEYGIFRQTIQNGWQVEQPDHWLTRPSPWEVPRPNEAVEVKLNCSFEIRGGALRVLARTPVIANWHSV